MRGVRYYNIVVLPPLSVQPHDLIFLDACTYVCVSCYNKYNCDYNLFCGSQI
jgi:hypothetical protein